MLKHEELEELPQIIIESCEQNGCFPDFADACDKRFCINRILYTRIREEIAVLEEKKADS